VSWLKTLLAAVIGLIILAVGILFTVHNTEPVAIDLVFVQLPEMTLSLWLIIAFLLGGVVGLLLSGVTILTLRTRLRSAQRKVSASRQEIEKLRAAALKDSG
jgi:putative membrane protein